VKNLVFMAPLCLIQNKELDTGFLDMSKILQSPGTAVLKGGNHNLSTGEG